MKTGSGKAAGADILPAEELKADIDATLEMLYPLFTRIWEDEELPADWKEGRLINLPKKDNLSKCSNYRGISLLSVPRKVFNRVILERVKDTVDSQLRDQQDLGKTDLGVSQNLFLAREIVHF